ncbi:DJ-1/PfpI family protein [Sorangium sp. So ce341]
MDLKGKKVAILIESDYYEPEIFYYQRRFEEERADLHFLTRLWGQSALTFKGHEWHVPFECRESFEGMSDDTLRSYSAIIVPSGMVADRLRYSEDVRKLAPATELLKRAFAEPTIVKGIICHGMWIMSTVPELVRGRRAVVNNNLVGDARNMGIDYIDQDLVVDGDLVTARTGNHAPIFARQIIDMHHRVESGIRGRGQPPSAAPVGSARAPFVLELPFLTNRVRFELSGSGGAPPGHAAHLLGVRLADCNPSRCAEAGAGGCGVRAAVGSWRLVRAERRSPRAPAPRSSRGTPRHGGRTWVYPTRKPLEASSSRSSMTRMSISRPQYLRRSCSTCRITGKGSPSPSRSPTRAPTS